MPGYRTLSPRVGGQVAELVREAEHRQREGDLAAAAELLERAIADVAGTQGALPAWACGRLAAIYRTLSRYDDEVALLERYCESSVTEEAKTRFIARLSKARAIAERRRRLDNGALRTVKEAKGRLHKSGRKGMREAELRAAHAMLESAG